MSDAALKDLLRQEHRRRKAVAERGERSEKGDRGDRSEKGERSEKAERGERSEKKKPEKHYTDRERDEKETRRRQREQSERERERERQQQREEKFVERVSILPVKQVEVVESIEPQTEKFIFVFEDDNGVLHADISKIALTEGNTLKIFPVYLSGHNTNLTEEVVTFTEGKLTPSEENKETTWLNVIQSREVGVEILLFDLTQVVIYNNRFFHCQDDLLDYIETNGCEFIPVV